MALLNASEFKAFMEEILPQDVPETHPESCAYAYLTSFVPWKLLLSAVRTYSNEADSVAVRLQIMDKFRELATDPEVIRGMKEEGLKEFAEMLAETDSGRSHAGD